jgi:hypothetical protein
VQIAKKIKAKKCRSCKTDFIPSRPLQVACGPRCALSLAKEKEAKKIEKARKEELKVWNKEYKERKEKDKKLSEYEHDARVVFQRWIRRRDRDQPCISCGRRNTDSWDGGHYLDAGLYSGLIFHEDNVHKQCSRPCNKDYHGNKVNYRIGLVKRIGEARVKWLEENKDRVRNYKYTKDELIQIKKEYQKRLKE